VNVLAPALHPAPVRRWLATLGATAVSTYALDLVASAAGVALAATGLLHGAPRLVLLGFLALTYVAWGAGLGRNLSANWALLQRTGTSTNALSKAAHDLAALRGWRPRAQRMAGAAGYVATEVAKEAPYYAGAFGAAVVSDSIAAGDAIVFLGGANLGAAAYEYGLAGLTRAFLRRGPRCARPRRASRSCCSAPAQPCITCSCRPAARRRSISPTTCRRTSPRSSAGCGETPARMTGARSCATRSSARAARRRATRSSRSARS
jgi:hypothetical protein